MVYIFITLNQLFLNQDFLYKFWRMKGANRYMKILLVLFQEQNSFGTIWSFQPLAHFLLFDWEWSNWARPLLIGSLNSQDMISFMITTGFLNSQDMISFMITIGSLNSQDMISFMITTGSLNNQDMTGILKQWRHDFSGKNVRDRYCMDIMSCLEVKVHGFVKLP